MTVSQGAVTCTRRNFFPVMAGGDVKRMRWTVPLLSNIVLVPLAVIHEPGERLGLSCTVKTRSVAATAFL